MQTIINWIGQMDPVGRDTHPNLACAIGFLFGGIGLAVYFRTVIDLLVPVAIVVFAAAAIAAIGALGWLAGAGVAALYGYQRSATSNANRAAAAHPGAVAAATS